MSLTSAKANPHRFTYWFSLVPLCVKLLVCFQAEESISGHIVHLVVHNPMRFGIKTLQESKIRSAQSRRAAFCGCGDLKGDYFLFRHLSNPNIASNHSSLS